MCEYQEWTKLVEGSAVREEGSRFLGCEPYTTKIMQKLWSQNASDCAVFSVRPVVLDKVLHANTSGNYWLVIFVLGREV